MAKKSKYVKERKYLESEGLYIFDEPVENLINWLTEKRDQYKIEYPNADIILSCDSYETPIYLQLIALEYMSEEDYTAKLAKENAEREANAEKEEKRLYERLKTKYDK